VTLLEEMIEFHPDYLAGLNDQDRDVLSQYYFAGREVDADDLGRYRDDLVVKVPDIEAKAQDALARFKAAAKVQ
jgi:hypothetical protein